MRSMQPIQTIGSQSRFPRLLAYCLMVCGGVAVAGLPAAVRAVPSDSDGEPGITKPSQPFIPDARGNASEGLELAFPYAGPLAEVRVVEGQEVKKGDVLVVQDTSIDRAALAVADEKAKSKLQEDAAKVDHKAKLAALKRKKELRAKDVATPAELEEAQANADLAKIRIAVAAHERRVAQLEADEIRARMKLRTLVSPIDGVIHKLDAAPGKMADPSAPSVIIIKNDPLWVEVKLPTTATKKMEFGDELQVRYADETDWRTAKVIFLDPYADATSQTRMVKLQLANPDGHPAGLHVMVQTPAKPDAEAAAAKADR